MYRSCASGNGMGVQLGIDTDVGDVASTRRTDREVILV